ncbi:hypothetical protein HN385_01910 [archaeon]|jgi:hypothetical protein|nr:hypothetical protein [archaeon]MBT3451295.1 hypothetical protein [archaeon]MBT6869444.1 hypothetical protein [archaeon]MBT7192607.1 hypothetical protein [archaeon]MBT7380683.1 hypothetical protein [archaeon]
MPNLLDGLVEKKTLAILKTLSNNQNQIYNLNYLSTQSKVSISSTFRIVKKLCKSKFIKEIRIGKTKLYQFSKNNKSNQIKKLILTKLKKDE